MVDFNRFEDVDPQETQEWLESMDSVLQAHGPERAHFLLNSMIDHARRSGAYLPYSATTAYLNTIPVWQQPSYPGDRAIERRIEAYIRWNAMAMVVQANRRSSEYGGHIVVTFNVCLGRKIKVTTVCLGFSSECVLQVLFCFAAFQAHCFASICYRY